ncbi:PilZ domain-containing protein [Caulobacter segnis]
MDQDRRSAVRIPTQRSGKLLCGTFAWDCLIRDLSGGGAKIQMLSNTAPPGQASTGRPGRGPGLRRDRRLATRPRGGSAHRAHLRPARAGPGRRRHGQADLAGLAVGPLRRLTFPRART